jgi:hypothetical protein
LTLEDEASARQSFNQKLHEYNYGSNYFGNHHYPFSDKTSFKNELATSSTYSFFFFLVSNQDTLKRKALPGT